jgi:hypothetical protein
MSESIGRFLKTIKTLTLPDAWPKTLSPDRKYGESGMRAFAHVLWSDFNPSRYWELSSKNKHKQSGGDFQATSFAVFHITFVIAQAETQNFASLQSFASP